ncbi:peptidoglycan-binding protein [Candidatus Dojkabacteria bacterium]|uniref:Peptidoglycan-binding protein n=1 Tax=Candidatus Dojkabacteria bacterium TaxID=2099670 RepID=A0A5C7J6Q8_9BACT|nr:MAG: peptidoglycan-binding protein [Candidatus Dojkabacteria bacterium]
MRKLFFGLMGEDVKKLQLKLQERGYAQFQPTTFFGVKTHQALRKFQANHFLPATGVFGETEASLLGLKDPTPKSEIFFNTAMSFVGKDVTPRDVINDEVACMETIDTIHYTAFGEYINGKQITVSTMKALPILLNSPKWKRVYKPEKGAILLYPTGYGNGNLSNGHIFVCDGRGGLYSNSSATGIFERNYSDSTAKHRYETIGGFPPYYFKLI